MAGAARLFLLQCFFICPILFFTDLTRNPYVTQIALLNIGLAWAAGATLLAQSRNPEWRLPKTVLDVPLAVWLGVCAFSWLWSYANHAAFYHPALRSEGIRIGIFTIVNTVLPFYLAAVCTHGTAQVETSVGRWAAFAIVWGGFWTMFPQLRTIVPPGAPGVMPHLWDPYGAILWAAGLAVLARLVWGATLHHYWHLLLTTCFLSAVYGICQYFNLELIWPKVLNPYGGRSVSTFGNPNFMSSVMVLMLPVAAAYFLKAKSVPQRVAYATVFLAMEGCLLASLTRSSWLGALAALAVFAASREVRRLARENLESLGMAASLAVLILIVWPQSSVSGYSPSVVGRVRELSDALNLQADIPYSPLYQRVLIWMSSWLMGSENPITGKGWGAFELFYPFYQGYVLDLHHFFRTMRTHANNSHNELLEIFSQTGILGLGAVLWMWTTFFAGSVKWAKGRQDSQRSEDTIWMFAGLAGVAGMLVDNLLNVSMHFAVPAFLFWWQAGTVMARASEGSTRTFRLPKPAASIVAAAVVAACAGCTWWWVKQWNREVHYFAGFKLLRSNQMGHAVEELERAYRWHHREVNTTYELGNAYAQSKLFPKAAWAYAEALSSNSGYDEIYYNLATIQSQHLGLMEEAYRNFVVSHWINPLSMPLYNAMTTFLLRDTKRFRVETIALLEQGLTFYPDNANFMNNLGYLYRLGGDHAKAEEYMARALRTNPDLQVAERNLMEMSRERKAPANPVLKDLVLLREVEARIGRKDYSADTLALARRALEAFPQSTKARFYVGNLEMVGGRPEKALEALMPLVRVEPQNAVLQRDLGEIYLRLGRIGEATEAFRTSLQSDPNNAYVRQRLAQLSGR
ncbi:MAG: tetratricopeptide repeat protein [Elusimicrobia bacterium]|nr:tetratricopeptide repeat protein [Elusimicrobiota bacterium]